MKPISHKYLAVSLTLLSMFPFLSCQSQKIDITPQFDAVKPFKNGIAAVKKEELWGFIDSTGNWIIQPRFYNVCLTDANEYICEEVDVAFQEILKKDSKCKWEVKPYYYDLPKINTTSGIRYIDQIDGKYVLTDEDGIHLTEPVYESIIYIGQDLFIGNKKYKEVLLNSFGKIVSKEYDEISPEVRYNRIKCKSDYHYGLLSIIGKEIVPPVYTLLEIAGKNIACSKGGDMKLYTDDLKQLSEFKFDYVVNLNNGNWVARNANTGESILYSLEGNILNKELHFGHEPMALGKIHASNKSGQWGYVDSNGKEAIPFRFHYTESFWPNGKAVVYQLADGKNKGFVIDSNGHKIPTPPFDKLAWHPDDVYTLEYENKNQLLDHKFQPITKLSRNPVEYIGSGVYIKYKIVSSIKIQKSNFYTGDKFKIYKSRESEIESIHALDGTVLIEKKDIKEEEEIPIVSEGFAVCKKGNKWGYIKCRSTIK